LSMHIGVTSATMPILYLMRDTKIYEVVNVD